MLPAFVWTYYFAAVSSVPGVRSSRWAVWGVTLTAVMAGVIATVVQLGLSFLAVQFSYPEAGDQTDYFYTKPWNRVSAPWQVE